MITIGIFPNNDRINDMKDYIQNFNKINQCMFIAMKCSPLVSIQLKTFETKTSITHFASF